MNKSERNSLLAIAAAVLLVALVLFLMYSGAGIGVVGEDPDEIVGLGTTHFSGLAVTGNTDLAGTLQYGSDDLYPVGYGSSGQQLVYGTSSITGTATAVHGLTTVTFALCVLGEDPTSGSGESAYCTVVVSGNTVTLKAWQDDFVTAATEADTAIQWLVVGAP